MLVPVTADTCRNCGGFYTPEVWLRWGDEAASPQWPFDPSATRFAVLPDRAVSGMVQ